jgi:hypothetical protein
MLVAGTMDCVCGKMLVAGTMDCVCGKNACSGCVCIPLGYILNIATSDTPYPGGSVFPEEALSKGIRYLRHVPFGAVVNSLRVA